MIHLLSLYRIKHVPRNNIQMASPILTQLYSGVFSKESHSGQKKSATFLEIETVSPP